MPVLFHKLSVDRVLRMLVGGRLLHLMHGADLSIALLDVRYWCLGCKKALDAVCNIVVCLEEEEQS